MPLGGGINTSASWLGPMSLMLSLVALRHVALNRFTSIEARSRRIEREDLTDKRRTIAVRSVRASYPARSKPGFGSGFSLPAGL